MMLREELQLMREMRMRRKKQEKRSRDLHMMSRLCMRILQKRNNSRNALYFLIVRRDLENLRPSDEKGRESKR